MWIVVRPKRAGAALKLETRTQTLQRAYRRMRSAIAQASQVNSPPLPQKEGCTPKKEEET